MNPSITPSQRIHNIFLKHGFLNTFANEDLGSSGSAGSGGGTVAPHPTTRGSISNDAPIMAASNDGNIANISAPTNKTNAAIWQPSGTTKVVYGATMTGSPTTTTSKGNSDLKLSQSIMWLTMSLRDLNAKSRKSSTSKANFILGEGGLSGKNEKLKG
jgi:hypothetical protein